MPFNQTEELFRSTLQAATDPSADDDAWGTSTPKYEAVDLGEAGKQEIWETDATRIEKLIAKHGGKRTPGRHKGVQEASVLMVRFGSSRSLSEIVDIPDDRPWATKDRSDFAEGSARYFGCLHDQPACVELLSIV